MEFQLFEIDEDGYFIPLELNPVKKKEKKSAKTSGNPQIPMQKMSKNGKNIEE